MLRRFISGGPVLALALLPALLPALRAAEAGRAPAPGPNSPLPQLLAERRALVQQYEAATAQRHALFGLSNQPSKKDLQQVVTALQGIVDKDNELVAALHTTTQQAQTTATTLQNTGRDDRNVTAQRLAELQTDLQNARLRQQQATERERALAADLTDAQHGRQLRDVAIAALGLLGAGLLLWRRR